MVIGTRHTLSESKSQKLLQEFGIEFAKQVEARDLDGALGAAKSIGFPMVAKLCGDLIVHKTERGLVKLGLTSLDQVELACTQLLAKATKADGEVALVLANQEEGSRELVLGLVTDHQFGKFVMLGLGGVSAEVIDDVVFSSLPIDLFAANEMIDQIEHRSIFLRFRGEAEVNRQQLVSFLVGISEFSSRHPECNSLDINPVIIRRDGSLVAVDALIEMNDQPVDTRSGDILIPNLVEKLGQVFNPRGVVVIGASTHPGKFGFVTLHNILVSGYKGQVFATNRDMATVLGIETVKSLEDLPSNEVDLAIVCTPADSNTEILRLCARKNITNVYVTSAGYGESGGHGAAAQTELADTAKSLGIVLLGPNGQGLVSTPVGLCAQIVGPYPPSGNISVVSQSGNFVSTFMNYSKHSGIGISRAVSVGNAALVGVPEVWQYLATDSTTDVVLTYLEGIIDGQVLAKQMTNLTRVKPLVVVKAGATESGARAASSHTGALASDDRLFDAVCRSAGASRVKSVAEAFDTAATFATQPLPKGSNVVVLTTVGGWGVVTADEIERQGVLKLMELPNDLRQEISKVLPSRWSNRNPVDCAGGETRDSVTTAMKLIAEHPQVDAVIFLGIGIQANQARLMRSGVYFPDYGLGRIVNYHEEQDARFGQLAAELSIQTQKPILVATELAVADRTNPGVLAVEASGRYCYADGQRASRALANVYRYSRWLGIAP